jgi:glycosyltransferase involved in cell wall biosynthesis
MTTDTVGGVWVYATALAARLVQAGARVTLATLGPPPQREHYELLPEGVGLVVTDLALDWLDPEGHDAARAHDVLLRLADSIAPDVVHLNGFREGSVPWQCPAILVAHSCVVSWWDACKGRSSMDRRWQPYRAAVATALDMVDAWVAPTRAFRDRVAESYRPDKRGVVIHNGIAPCDPGAHKDAIILASGRAWDEAKNLRSLADIAAGLPWPVEIAGSGMPASEATETAENVRWLGQLSHDDLLRRMRKAAVYAAPARYEPFGLGILEAASSGCALVLSDIPTLRELWDGVASFVPAGDSDALRDSILSLCGDPAALGRMQRKAAERAQRYTLDRMAAGYLALYDRVLDGSDTAGFALRSEVPA